MKKLILYILLVTPFLSFAQPEQFTAKQHTDGEYSWETVANDPLNARIYTLENGLKVYMSVYKDEPRIQTNIAVKAGSKNDPADATGLAHYLEHMLFKGTDDIGSQNWEKEQDELLKIEELYEKYRKTVSQVKRDKLYHQIDSISQVASKYALANEYDKLLSNLGATGTNAYTFVEQTVYVNEIPSNSLDKWAQIEAERFSMVAPRLFHTELEAVYEEKNRGLDSDGRKVWETMLEGTFPDHPYGTQTTIGTVEHLKNPSVTEIKKYFDKYYVPNNMAITLSGDFDPDSAIRIIDKHFSKLKPSEVKPTQFPAEKAPVGVQEKTVYGPDAESVTLAFRFNGRSESLPSGSEFEQISNTDPYALNLISMLLNNGQAGLIDLNLNKSQKVLSANAYFLPLNDHSIFVMSGKAKEGQSLEEVKALLLDQLDSIKNGKFDDWLVEAVINDEKISRMSGYESNKARADAFVESFIAGTPWNLSVMEMSILESFTKKDLVEFAKNGFTDDYLVVYKKQGKDSSVTKVPKPKITPVNVNRDNSSAFYKKVMEKPSPEIKPEFVDFNKEITRLKVDKKLPLLYKENKENDLFSLNYVWDLGKENDPRYAVAAGYLSFLGTDKYSQEELNQEFYKLGCSFSLYATDDAIYFSLSGLNENFDKAYALFEQLIMNAKPNEKALKDYVGRILKSRSDAKRSKDVILRSAMVNHVKYGTDNPFTNIVPAEELKQLKTEDLIKLLKDLYKLEHRALYYGPKPSTELAKSIQANHRMGKKLAKIEKAAKFKHQPTDTTTVYFVDYDMVQAEVIFLTKGNSYDKSLTPQATLFNEYFGGSMGSLVFQEMRESKALAYSVKSSYSQASKMEDPDYLYSYIGTQADKLDEAIRGMEELMNNMPQADPLFETARTSILENINSRRITKGDVLMQYERLKKLGIDKDIRKDVYEQVAKMDFSQIRKFQEEKVKDKPKAILVIGSKDKINMEDLKKYGPVKELSLEELFGY